jgi:tetratricopeptide (TPR) repeat protein
MATIVSETVSETEIATLSNYEVQERLRCCAKTGSLRELVGASSARIDTGFEFIVGLASHKDWISSPALYGHLVVTTKYLIETSYSDCPTLDPPYESLRALQNCVVHQQSLLERLKFQMIKAEKNRKNQDQMSLRARMRDQLTKMETNMNDQDTNRMFNESELFTTSEVTTNINTHTNTMSPSVGFDGSSGDPISRSSSLELDVGGGGGSSIPIPLIDFSATDAGNGSDYVPSFDTPNHNTSYNTDASMTTGTSQGGLSTQRRTRPRLDENGSHDPLRAKICEEHLRGDDTIEDAMDALRNAGIRGKKDQPNRASSHRGKGLIWTCVPNSKDDAEFAKQCDLEKDELQVITGAEVFSGTIEQLREKLASSRLEAEPIRWIHFIGHCSQRSGGNATLSLVNTDSEGNKEIMNEENFVKIITSLEIRGEKLIKMISLNTCNSASLAQTLKNAGISSVWGWNSLCRGEAVRTFATSFYKNWYCVGNLPCVAVETAKCALLAITTVDDIEGETKQGHVFNRYPKYTFGSLTIENIEKSRPMIVGDPCIFPPSVSPSTTIQAVRLMKLCLDEFPYWLRRIFKHEFNKKWSNDVGKWEDLDSNTRGSYLWNGCRSTDHQQDATFSGMVKVQGKVFKTENKELQQILYNLPPGARIKIRVDDGSIQECTLQNIKKEQRVKIQGRKNKPGNFSLFVGASEDLVEITPTEDDDGKRVAVPVTLWIPKLIIERETKAQGMIKDLSWKIEAGDVEIWDTPFLIFELINSSHAFWLLGSGNTGSVECLALYHGKNKRNQFCHIPKSVDVTEALYTETKELFRKCVETCCAEWTNIDDVIDEFDRRVQMIEIVSEEENLEQYQELFKRGESMKLSLENHTKMCEGEFKEAKEDRKEIAESLREQREQLDRIEDMVSNNSTPSETKTTQQTEPLGIIPLTALPKLLSIDVHVEHLNQVVQLLLNDEDGSSNHLGFVGIKAMGGQGKTVMLSRLAHAPTVLLRFSGGVVWINVGRVVDSMNPLLSQMARAFKIETDKDKTDEQQNIAIVEELKRMKNGSDIVLMLDNIWGDSLQAVKEFLHVCPKDVRVVMTSRDASAVDELGGTAIDLSELSLEAAVQMLREQCNGVILDDEDAKALALACGRHVLALCHVGTQLRKGTGRRNVSPQSILKKIQDKKKVLSKRFKTRGKKKTENEMDVGKKKTENEMDVFACLALSFDMLDEDDQEDERKLALGLSMFSSEKSIPLGALLRLCEFADLDEVREVVAELEMRSIVSSLSEDGVVTLHGFMHEVLTERRLNGGDLEEVFGATMVDTALNYFNAFHFVCDGSRFDSLKTAMEKYGMELGEEEEIVMAAVQVNGTALKFCSERLRGEEKIVRAAMKNFEYGSLEGMLQFGENVTAMVDKILREDLKENEEKLGPDHSFTLMSVLKLGNLLHTRGQLDEAESLYRRALKGKERTLGPDHSDTLLSVNNLGSLLQTRGQLDEAEPLLRRALEGEERTLGPDHSVTLASVNNLGSLLHKRGQIDEAEPLYRRALEGSERTLGLDHSSTLKLVDNLGSLLQARGQLDEAEPLYRRALEGSERTLGPDHSLTLRSVNNLASLLRERGQLDEAEPLYRCALEGRKRTLGPDHEETLTSVNNLGVLLCNCNRFEEAEKLLRPNLERFVKTFGSSHPTTLKQIKVLDFLKKKNSRHKKKQKPNDKCACGSNKKYKKCCKNK